MNFNFVHEILLFRKKISKINKTYLNRGMENVIKNKNIAVKSHRNKYIKTRPFEGLFVFRSVT